MTDNNRIDMPGIEPDDLPPSLREHMTPRLAELLRGANQKQIRWITARLLTKNGSDAARMLGINRRTVQRWGNLRELEEAVRLIQLSLMQEAALRLEEAAPKAVEALVKALDVEGERVQAAKIILDRVGLTQLRRIEVAGREDGPVVFVTRLAKDLSDNQLAAIVDAGQRGWTILPPDPQPPPAPPDDARAETGGQRDPETTGQGGKAAR